MRAERARDPRLSARNRQDDTLGFDRRPNVSQYRHRRRYQENDNQQRMCVTSLSSLTSRRYRRRRYVSCMLSNAKTQNRPFTPNNRRAIDDHSGRSEGTVAFMRNGQLAHVTQAGGRTNRPERLTELLRYDQRGRGPTTARVTSRRFLQPDRRRSTSVCLGSRRFCTGYQLGRAPIRVCRWHSSTCL